MSLRLLLPLVLFVPVPLLTACEKQPADQGSGAAAGANAGAAARCPHDIKQEKCPFCTPALIESEGFCGEHGVAEALCAQCRPYLKAAFRAKGDWCKDHDAPKSQCVVCNPALKANVRQGEHGVKAPSASAPPAAGTCPHSISQASCPFCTPSLIETEGFCEEHGVAEALCVKCRPYLEAAFREKGDWCGEHGTPESQCTDCNPDLRNKAKGPSQGVSP